jgi:tRNA uridine 5-carboxymethylaminomethyl modification enzyme
LNAARRSKGESPWSPRRDEAYLGVLVDDLVTRGVSEPYRMFTSRAEYRLQLREDNADLRLTEIGRRLGLVDDQRWEAFNRKRDAIERETQRLKHTFVSASFHQKQSLIELLRRPEINYASLVAEPPVSAEVAAQVEIQAKYEGYIERQKREVERRREFDSLSLPTEFDYRQVRGLSVEAQEKLNQYKPETVGQASRISGITPAAISLLLVHLKRGLQPSKKTA